MNVILIMSDSFRYDFVGSNGNPWIKTPNLDRFAQTAWVFENAYCGSFPTIPNRTDIHAGYWTLLRRDWSPLPDTDYTLSRHLGKNGFTTMLIHDTYHLGYNNFRLGFKGWKWIRGQEGDTLEPVQEGVKYPLHPTRHIESDPRGSGPRHLANNAARQYEEDYISPRTFLCAERWLEYNYDKGDFFLAIDTFDPHEPWDPPWWYVNLYDPDYNSEPVIYHPKYQFTDEFSEAQVKHAKARYAAEATMVDRWCGRFLQKAEDMGLFENTMIIFMSDHGFLAGEHGRFGKSNRDWKRFVDQDPRYLACWPFYDQVRRTNLMVHIPGLGQGRTRAIVQPVDIFPTICDVLGLEQPDILEGKSFRPVLEGKTQAHREWAITSTVLKSDLDDKRRMVSITDGKWSLQFSGRENETILFDLENDPGEEQDVKEQHPDVAKSLHQGFLDYFGSRAPEPARLETYREMK